MDRPLKRNTRLDADVRRIALQLRSPRSCVVAVTNATSFTWELAAVVAHHGEFSFGPPAGISPWSHAVFAAQSGAAHAGAGCAGTVRYRSGRSTALAVDVEFDLPYAGSAAIGAGVTGSGERSIATSVERVDGIGNATIVFIIHLASLGGPSHPTFRMGASSV